MCNSGSLKIRRGDHCGMKLLALCVLYLFCVNVFLEEQGGMYDSYDRPDGDVRLCQPALVLSRRRLVIYQPPRHSPLPVVYIFA